MASFTPDMPIGVMLRLRFEELKPMTQAEAGTACGVQQSSFNRWLNGKAAPRPEHIPAVARYLDAAEAVVLAGIQHFKMRDQLRPGLEDRIRYMSEQLVAFQERFVPEDQRKEAAEVISEIFEWLPDAMKDAAASVQAPANEQFSLAADTGDERRPAGKRQNRPSPPPEPEGP